MKLTIYSALVLSCLNIAHAQTPREKALAARDASVQARQEAQSFNAPEFLKKQNVDTCMTARILDRFKKEQFLEKAEAVTLNSNGKEEVNSITGSRYNGQEIQSGVNTYSLILRFLDSGLNGETLTVLAAKESCEPTKAYIFNGTEYRQIRLANGQCFEAPKREPRLRRKPGDPVPSPTPPPPRSTTEKFCTILKGEEL